MLMRQSARLFFFLIIRIVLFLAHFNATCRFESLRFHLLKSRLRSCAEILECSQPCHLFYMLLSSLLDLLHSSLCFFLFRLCFLYLLNSCFYLLFLLVCETIAFSPQVNDLLAKWSKQIDNLIYLLLRGVDDLLRILQSLLDFLVYQLF